MQAWAALASRAQRNVVNIVARGDLTLIGWDSNAYINGAQIQFLNTNNVISKDNVLHHNKDCH